MSGELNAVWEYVRAVAKHWGVIVIGLGLTVLDFVERMFGTWFIIPLWLRVTVGVAGLIVAQYMAYRDFLEAKKREVTDEQISAHLTIEALRSGVSQLEAQIDCLKEENAKLRMRIKP